MKKLTPRLVGLEELNAMVNAPDVLPLVNPLVSFLNLSWIYETPGALVIGFYETPGAAILLPKNNGYEMHYLGHQKGGLATLKAVVDWVFTDTPAHRIFGSVSRSNLAARLVSRWLGGVSVNTQAVDGAGRPCIVYELTREKWAS